MSNPNLVRKTVDPTQASSTGEIGTLSQIIPPGTIFDSAATSAPAGWLFCDGTVYLIANYPALFASISNVYGGNGTTTFAVPDVRGRTRAGKDNMGGVAANRLTAVGSGINGTILGTSGGAETHTLSTAQLPAHNHSVPFSGGAAGGAAGSGVVFSGTPPTVTGNNGSGTAHPNVQPTIVFNAIIKY